jgi:DNA-binding transcriptional LysR family regulator
MDIRWLRLFLELADRGTLRAAAQATGYSTSNASQQLTALQRSFGATLVEPAGRRLQLTPAGRALLPYARTVLATLDAARGSLAADAEPTGVVRVAGYATALVRQVMPAVRRLQREHPGLVVAMQEREPSEVESLLATDAIDVGLVWEYSLVPRSVGGLVFAEAPIALVVPTGDTRGLAELLAEPTVGWIANSRAHDDEELIGRVGARFGVQPTVTHRIDSLDLLTEVVAAGLGVALVSTDGPRPAGVRYVPLDGVAGTRIGHALTRPGRAAWPANAALLSAL